MFTVYILYSNRTQRYYYGRTSRSALIRLMENNAGRSNYTKYGCPWTLVWEAKFQTEELAFAFERYLKTPSGHAFSRKRLLL